MRYYLDTEFNSFQGDLISLALAPSDSALPTFYVVVEGSWQSEPHAWVKDHVVPHIADASPVSREEATRQLQRYMMFTSDGARAEIVADWPTDFTHFLELLITGPGMMVNVADFDLQFRNLHGFNTADHSKVPHHAMYDAIALREFVEGKK